MIRQEMAYHRRTTNFETYPQNFDRSTSDLEILGFANDLGRNASDDRHHAQLGSENRSKTETAQDAKNLRIMDSYCGKTTPI